jgi:hypothetical protein
MRSTTIPLTIPVLMIVGINKTTSTRTTSTTSTIRSQIRRFFRGGAAGGGVAPGSFDGGGEIGGPCELSLSAMAFPGWLLSSDGIDLSRLPMARFTARAIAVDVFGPPADK